MQTAVGFDLQFSPAFNETTAHDSSSLTIALRLVFKPKNCELKQKVSTLPTQQSITLYLYSIEYQHHKVITHYQRRLFFFHPKIGCLSVPIFMRYVAEEIPVSFPYRDTRTIRELYRSVMKKISGSEVMKQWTMQPETSKFVPML